MWTAQVVIIVILATFIATSAAGLVGPAVAHAAPTIAIGYTNAIPFNIPPYSDRVDIFSKALAFPVAAAPVLHATPLSAGVIPQPVAYAPALTPHALSAAHGVLPHALPAAHGVLPQAAPLASGVVPPNILPAYSAALGHSLPAHAYATHVLRR